MSDHKKLVAIVGVSCRFPGAKNYEQFWENLCKGVNSVQEVRGERWESNKQYAKFKNLYGNDKFKWAGLIDQIDLFDHEFFNISPKEAAVMDPQQRLLLEESWRCIEDSGVSLRELQSHHTSVHIGVSAVDYQYHLCGLDRETTGYDTLGLYPCVLSNRLSYYLNLTGPSQSLDTACASSLVALHDAKENILSGNCEYALVGGVVLIGYPWRYLSFIKANMLSPDGKCKTFDASADGFVPGEGLGVVLLESLESAIKNKHHIYAVIQGSSVHHSGRSKALTAPSMAAQKRVITEALKENSIDCNSITYLEAHGTGTSLGDPIEVAALTQAFDTREKQYCQIGSVKTNIGHLGAASGIAGLVKLILMMKYKEIPPTLNVSTVNPLIDFVNSPFKIADQLSNWNTKDGLPRRAGVSSFGFGGVNSHVVIEEFVPQKNALDVVKSPIYPFLLSAKSPESLKKLLDSWKTYCETSQFESQEMADISGTLIQGRENFSWRYGIFARDTHDLKKKILSLDLNDQELAQNTSEVDLNDCVLVLRASQQHFDFETLYQLSNQILEAGLTPHCLTGIGFSALVSVVLSGMIDIHSARDWLLNHDTRIHLTRPKIPFFDPLNKKILQPFNIPSSYLSELIQEAEFEPEVERALWAQTRKLLQSQRTFSKLIKEWSNFLSGHGIDFENCLEHWGKIEENTKFAVSMAMIFCIKKLNLKWNLPEKIQTKNPYTLEIIDLLLDEVLLPADFLNLFFKNPKQSENDILKNLEPRLKKMDFSKSYRLLKKLNLELDEIKNPNEWLLSLYELNSLQEGLDLAGLESSWYAVVDDSWVFNAEEKICELLMRAWKKSSHIHWQKCFSYEGSSAISLPVYEFNGHRFWPETKSLEEADFIEASLAPVQLESTMQSAGNLIQQLAEVPHTRLLSSIQDYLKKQLRLLLNIPEETPIPDDKGFFNLGMDSISGTEFIQKIQESIGDVFVVRPTVVYDYPNLSALSNYLLYNLKLENAEKELKNTSEKFAAPIREERRAKEMGTIRISPENIGFIIDNFAVSALGSDKGKGYSRVKELRGMGFSDGKLSSFSSALSSAFHQEFHSRFFITHPTTQSIIDYFMDQQANQYKNWLYDIEWIELPTPLLPLTFPRENGVWIIFADESDFSDILIQKLSVYGQRIMKVVAGNRFQKISKNEIHIRAEVEEDFNELIKTPEFTNGISGIIYLWGLYKNVPEEPLLSDLEYYHRHACSALLFLIKGLSKLHGQTLPQLIVTTWSLHEEGDATSLAQWPITGLCKSISMEYPEFFLKRITLDASQNIQKSSDYLFLELWSKDMEDQISWRGEKRYGPRLIRQFTEDTSLVEFKKSATYLVIGGFGLGLVLADWLAARGAQHIVLLSHNAFSPELKTFVNAIKEKNIDLRYHADLHFQDFKEMQSIINDIQKDLPPIKGLLFFPADIHDQLLRDMEWTDFKNILDLKVGGAWNFHLLTKELNLDYFILFSSLGSILDPRSKANRSTANAFLDALSFYKRARGQHAMTINWGPIGNEGMPIKNVLEQNVPSGLGLFSADEVLNVLGHLMTKKTHQIVVAKIQWEDLLGHYMIERPLLFNMEQEIGIRKSEILIKFKYSRQEERLDVLKRYVRSKLRRILHLMPTQEFDEGSSLESVGFDAIMLGNLFNHIQYDIGTQVILPRNLVSLTKSIGDVSHSLYDLLDKETFRIESTDDEIQDEPIAVIGMDCRLPAGSMDPESFWKALCDGVDGSQEIPPERFDVGLYYNPDPEVPGKMTTKKGSFITNIDLFDANFFGISPKKATLMDPQQRLFLQCCWRALERAGIPPYELKNSLTGVFVGVSNNDYGTLILQNPSKNDLGLDFRTGNVLSAVSAGVSYALGLSGPSMSVDAACSSSLVSVYSACKSLKTHDCDLALAGGVNILLQPDIFISLSKGKTLSPDGHCKSFDASANGYLRGEGIGVLVLKRLKDAQRDNDPILAVIKGGAVHQNGPSSGITVPNGPAQQALMREALKQAGLQPRDISYVEAHATGTPLGDPIEVGAIAGVYSEGRSRDEALLLGALKSNIGHLESAAGIASLIKVILCLNNKKIPPNLHFKTLNPNIDLESIPAKLINTEMDWSVPPNQKRRAGVSGFGFTGTIAHLILEEVEEGSIDVAEALLKPEYFIGLSAKTEAALTQKIVDLQSWLRLHSAEVSLEEISYTLNAGRSHFNLRCALVVNSKEDLLWQLDNNKFIHKGKTGQNIQLEYESFIQKIVESTYQDQQAYHALLLELAEYYISGINVDWKILHRDEPHRKILLPVYPFQNEHYWSESATPGHAHFDADSHPLLGSKEILPSGQIIFSNQILLSRLPYLCDHRVYQFIVCPGSAFYEMFVASGKWAFNNDQVRVENASIETALKFEPGRETEIKTVLTKQSENTFEIEIFSNLSSDHSLAPTWQRHAKALVLIDQEIDPETVDIQALRKACSSEILPLDFYKMMEEDNLFYGEAFQSLKKIKFGGNQVFGKIVLGPSEIRYYHHPALLDACFQLVAVSLHEAKIEGEQVDPYLPVGCEVILSYGPSGKQIFALWSLAEYTRDRVKGDFILFDENGDVTAKIIGMQYHRATAAALKNSLNQDPILNELLYEWAWKEQEIEGNLKEEKIVENSLIFINPENFSAHFLKTLCAFSKNSTVIEPKNHPETKEDFSKLLLKLVKSKEEISIYIVTSSSGESAEEVRQLQNFGTKTLLHLVQSLIELKLTEQVFIYLVTSGAESINSSADLANSPLTAQHKSIALEIPELKIKQIDLDPESRDDCLIKLRQDILTSQNEKHIAYHQGKRFVGRFLHKKLEITDHKKLIDPEATYLITGGLGGVGLVLAQWLANQGASNIILTGRSEVGKDAKTKIDALKQRGVHIQIKTCDISIREEVFALMKEITEKKVPLKGIFHLAGIIDDAGVMKQNWERYEKVFSAKVYGSLYLHEVTQKFNIVLDHFVVFSSRAASRGSFGQSNYAAANGFMDALCYYRNKKGLPAKSLAWGAWSEAGAAVTLVDAQAKLGLLPLRNMEALKCMDAVLHSDAINVTIGRFNWSKLLRQFVEVPTWLSAFNFEKESIETIFEMIQKSPEKNPLMLLKEFISLALRSVLGLSENSVLNEDAEFFEMGLDSLMAIDLSNRIQNKFGPSVKLSGTFIFDHPTLDQLLEYLKDFIDLKNTSIAIDQKPKNKVEKKSKNIIIHQPRPQAKYRLFTFPYAGGSAAWFKPWNDFLPEDIELVAVEIPGRISSALRPTSDVKEIVSTILPDIEALSDKPFCIYGHSAGVCSAVETVLTLEKMGLKLPDCLIVSSRPSPHLSMKNRIYDLSDFDFIEAMRTKYGAVPDEILKNEVLRNRLLPILKADITVHETYQLNAGVEIPVPVVVMGGESDLSVSVKNLGTWEVICTKGFKLMTYPGGHFFIDEHREQVLLDISKIIHSS